MHRWRKCYLWCNKLRIYTGRFSHVLQPDWSWFQYCHLSWFGQMYERHLLQWPASLQISWQFLTSRTWVSFPGFSIGKKPPKPHSSFLYLKRTKCSMSAHRRPSEAVGETKARMFPFLKSILSSRVWVFVRIAKPCCFQKVAEEKH